MGGAIALLVVLVVEKQALANEEEDVVSRNRPMVMYSSKVKGHALIYSSSIVTY